MANIIDYLHWRGDISFECSTLNEIDNLILANLSYIHFEDIAKCNFSNGTKLSTLIDKFLKKNIKKTKMFRVKEDILFLQTLRKSNRFKDLKIYGILNIIDHKKEAQFSAITIEISESLYYVSYGGTDWSITGWKEDLNLSYIKEVPAQKYAKDYINNVIKFLKGKIYIGGHSKGGNLSIYAAMKCDKQDRIMNIFNNDGPGLSEITDIKKYNKIKNKIIKIVPQDSVIGMFFDNNEKLTIIKSDTIGILQHELYTWQLLGPSFIIAKSLSSTSKILRKSLKSWLNKMNIKEREIFVSTIYKLFGKGKITYVYDLTKIKNIIDNFQSFINLTDEERDLISKYLFEFFKIIIKNTIPK